MGRFIDSSVLRRNQCRVTIAPIIPTARREPFDGPEWTFELKFDGFRAIADTVNGRILSKRGNRMHRFEKLLGSLPADCILDGEIVALDAAGRPLFADLMFGRRPPIFVAFDVMVDRVEDVRALPLARRKAALRRLAKGARRWIAIADGVPGQGRRLFDLVVSIVIPVHPEPLLAVPRGWTSPCAASSSPGRALRCSCAACGSKAPGDIGACSQSIRRRSFRKS